MCKLPINSNNEIKKLLKIYSINGEHIKKIGQILASQLSREIYILLVDNELNAKEVAKIVCTDGEIRLPNVISILNKMVKSGLVHKYKKRQKRSGHTLGFYKAVPVLLIVPSNNVEKMINSKTLENTLHRFFPNI